VSYNVVVICVDTFRADMGGAGGKLDFVKTPNVDRLRGESVSFTRCFGEGEPTIPVRRCLFTGRRSYPWRFDTPNEGLQPSGTGWHPIPHEADTLTEILHDAGWLTGLVADTYHMFKPTMNFTRGFLTWDFIRGQENDSFRSGPLDAIDLAAHVPDGEDSVAQHPTLAQYLLNAQGRKSEEDWQAAQVFRTAADWLRDNRANAPFFLWVDSFSPHEMWDPPREYADAYCAAKEGVRDIIFHQAFGRDPKRMTEDEVARCAALYYGFVTFVDRWIGHLIATMDSLALWEDTIVVFLTDHGTQILDKGAFGKGPGQLYPFNTQMNWFVRHPDGPTGVSCDAWTQNDDFFPTLLNLLGVPPPASHEAPDGDDMWPVATGGQPSARDHVVTGWGRSACVRDDRWAVHFDNVTTDAGIRSPRLYDLLADPAETEDVSSAHPAALEVARGRLADVVGDLPATFTQYTQRSTARSMRTFEPSRPG
jgi:arylsulfatase A-like enzyme